MNLAYVISHKQKIESQIDFDDLLKELNSKYGLGISGLSKFRYCRQLRNKVAHENCNVTEEEALSVKNYLEEIVSILMPFIKSTLETEFKNL